MSIKELRMKFTEEDIKNLLAKYGVFVQMETEKALVFPTACHNLKDGSPKLYYYKDEKIFKCYTGCNSMFDIFTLLQKIKALRGEEITVGEAIKISGVEQEERTESKDVLDDLAYLRRLRDGKDFLAKSEEEEENKEILDKKIIDMFTFNEAGLSPWIEEGIGKEALRKYNIRYDSVANAIIIPNLNHEGELVGIRGRFFGENAIAKYMPIKYKGKILNHPTGKYLYGFYENKNTIRSKGMAIIFEGEKSVMKMETFYPNDNIAVATEGKKITLEQMNALLKLGIREVILAYDKDYRNKEEREAKIEEYDKILSVLKPFFSVSMLIDFENKLNYQDSPIDGGKEIFDELIKNRLKR